MDFASVAKAVKASAGSYARTTKRHRTNVGGRCLKDDATLVLGHERQESWSDQNRRMSFCAMRVGGLAVGYQRPTVMP